MIANYWNISVLMDGSRYPHLYGNTEARREWSIRAKSRKRFLRIPAYASHAKARNAPGKNLSQPDIPFIGEVSWTDHTHQQSGNRHRGPVEVLSLVEVLSGLPYSPAPHLFTVQIDYLAHVIVLVLIMACTIPDLIATVVAESHGFLAKISFHSRKSQPEACPFRRMQ